MSVNRVQVIWSGTLIAGGGLTTFYFSDATGTPAQHVSAAALYLSATEAQRVTSCSWATDTDVATLNVGTGTLEGITNVASTSGVGTAAGDAMPPTTQGLQQLFTNSVTTGRLLRGRLFLPGAPESVNGSTGVPMSAIATAYNAAAATLIANANADWSVWSKTHGVLASVQSVAFWPKWAVLRSRRD